MCSCRWAFLTFTVVGVDYPKGMFDVGLPSKKSLYQLQAERIRRLEQIANETYGTNTASIPWCVHSQSLSGLAWEILFRIRFIMTSEHTQGDTESYLCSHGYFGLKRENIVLFEQHTLPAMDFQGRILLEEKHRLTKAADGNGGLYRALKTRGMLDEMRKRQIQYIHVYSVDNILVRLADPVFIGFCLEKQSDCAAKVRWMPDWFGSVNIVSVQVVKKTAPNEAVGVICKVRDRFQVVEYSEISETTAQRKKADNSDELLFNAGNICNHFFTLDFLNDVCQ